MTDAGKKLSKSTLALPIALTSGADATDSETTGSKTTGSKTTLSRLLAEDGGRWLVLYFYPKDSTPGCTTEGNDFNALLPKFRKLCATVVGASRDSLVSHAKFRGKQGFRFELASDPDEALCRAFDVIKPKKLYGREFVGVERSTFLIDPQGTVRREWRKVKVPGHAEAVLDTLKELRSE